MKKQLLSWLAWWLDDWFAPIEEYHLVQEARWRAEAQIARFLKITNHQLELETGYNSIEFDLHDPDIIEELIASTLQR